MKKMLFILLSTIIFLSSCARPPQNEALNIPQNNILELNPINTIMTTTNVKATEIETTYSEKQITDKTDEYWQNDDYLYEPCSHGIFNEVYHSFDSEFLVYVGAKNYHDWFIKIQNEKELYATEKCAFMTMTLPRFIKDFEITRNEFEVLLRTTDLYYGDYNLDVLYSGDDELIEEYYTSDWFRQKEKEDKALESRYKSELFNILDNKQEEKKNNWKNIYDKNKTSYLEDVKSLYIDSDKNQNKQIRSKSLSEYIVFDSNNYRLFSIPEIIYYFDIPKEAAESIKYYSKDLKETFDLEYIYGEGRQTLEKLINTGVDPVEIDKIINNHDKKDEKALLKMADDVIAERAERSAAMK